MKKPRPKPIFKLKWWMILSFYIAVLLFTGITTFSVNNAYATDRPRGLFEDPDIDSRNNMRKVLSVQDIESFHLFKELLEIELFNVEEVNDLSSQSFTIVLGALLGFLAATANALSKGKGKGENPAPEAADQTPLTPSDGTEADTVKNPVEPEESKTDETEE